MHYVRDRLRDYQTTPRYIVPPLLYTLLYAEEKNTGAGVEKTKWEETRSRNGIGENVEQQN